MHEKIADQIRKIIIIHQNQIKKYQDQVNNTNKHKPNYIIKRSIKLFHIITLAFNIYRYKLHHQNKDDSKLLCK